MIETTKTRIDPLCLRLNRVLDRELERVPVEICAALWDGERSQIVSNLRWHLIRAMRREVPEVSVRAIATVLAVDPGSVHYALRKIERRAQAQGAT